MVRMDLVVIFLVDHLFFKNMSYLVNEFLITATLEMTFFEKHITNLAEMMLFRQPSELVSLSEELSQASCPTSPNPPRLSPLLDITSLSGRKNGL